MTELVAAIIVVCLPALKSLIHRIETSHTKRSATAEGSQGNGYKSYPSATSHMKLSSGRDTYSTTTRIVATGEDSGSEVELNQIQQPNVIYKSERVSISSRYRENAD